MQKLLTTEEAAPLIGVTPGTLANWRCHGRGPRFLKAGSKVMYDHPDLEAWKESRRVTSTSEADSTRRDACPS